MLVSYNTISWYALVSPCLLSSAAVFLSVSPIVCGTIQSQSDQPILWPDSKLLIACSKKQNDATAGRSKKLDNVFVRSTYRRKDGNGKTLSRSSVRQDIQSEGQWKVFGLVFSH